MCFEEQKCPLFTTAKNNEIRHRSTPLVNLKFTWDSLLKVSMSYHMYRLHNGETLNSAYNF